MGGTRQSVGGGTRPLGDGGFDSSVTSGEKDPAHPPSDQYLETEHHQLQALKAAFASHTNLPTIEQLGKLRVAPALVVIKRPDANLELLFLWKDPNTTHLVQIEQGTLEVIEYPDVDISNPKEAPSQIHATVTNPQTKKTRHRPPQKTIALQKVQSSTPQQYVAYFTIIGTHDDTIPVYIFYFKDLTALLAMENRILKMTTNSKNISFSTP